MAKKVNEVQDGDLKSNIVVLRSVFGKVGQKYYIQPQKDARGIYAASPFDSFSISSGVRIISPWEFTLFTQSAYLPRASFCGCM